MICLISYFGLLLLVAHFTGKRADNSTFFTANRKSPWYLVAFGMIGTSISGVTFISVPGWVKVTGFTYFEVVLGYIAGYWLIAGVLMPIYYKLQLTTIYGYLKERYGLYGYKTGASFFLFSRILGAAFRLFIAVEVLQICVFNQWNVSFFISSSLVIFLIWLYTRRGGIKTIIWTDALQTFFLLAALAGTIFIIYHSLNSNLILSGKQGFMSGGNITNVLLSSEYFNVFNWDYKSNLYFFKQFISGVFIAIAMTGLDQDLMQKNLTCKSLPEAQKNMITFSIIQAVVIFFFLVLGEMLYIYAGKINFPLPSNTDDLYPMLATAGYLGTSIAFLFIMGLTASSFASADSALTALTTSFCIDILGIEQEVELKQERLRKIIHILMALILLLCIIVYKMINNEVIVQAVFKVAGYTYGPLLGLFSFGLLTGIRIKDNWMISFVCIISPIICYFISTYAYALFNYRFGFELLLLNAMITFIGLYCLSFIPIRGQGADLKRDQSISYKEYL